MKNLESKTIHKIKNNFKKSHDYKQYKMIFKNQQIRFLFTRMSVIFESSIALDYLTDLELCFIKNPTKDNFIDLVKKLSLTFDERFIDLNWEALAICLWYSFQTSIFYNKKCPLVCEYTLDNFMDLNNIKRKNFSIWLESFYNKKNIDFNKYVIRVLETII